MTSALPPWFLMFAVGLVGIALGGLAAWAWLTPRKKSPPLPGAWALAARPVFNLSERRLYRQLRDAFPQHVVMPKLPLVRLCQPEDLEQGPYWYSLLGSTHVSFAICRLNGQALLAIDLESRRSRSRRNLEIKEAVLATCGVKYFSMAADELPSTDALRLLMPNSGPEAAPAVPPDHAAAVARGAAADPIESTVTTDPPDRPGEWDGSSVFLDSFFEPDNRLQAAGNAASSRARTHPGPEAPGSTQANRSAAANDSAGELGHLDLDRLDLAVDWHRYTDVGGIVVDDTAAASTEETSAGNPAGR